MTCETPSWVLSAAPWLSLMFALLAVDVMQRTWHDEVNRRDHPVVQWLRRVGFMLMASNLGFMTYFAVTSQAYLFWVSLFCAYASGGYSLVINDLALMLRRAAPPTAGGGSRSADEFDRYSPGFIASVLREIRDDQRRSREDMREFGESLGRMDRGQLLTHLILQDVLMDLKLKSWVKAESAVILHPPQWRRRGDG